MIRILTENFHAAVGLMWKSWAACNEDCSHERILMVIAMDSPGVVYLTGFQSIFDIEL
jgi:hypothetical protein